MKKTIVLLALTAMAAATAVHAVPPFMSFQGVIKNDDGTPVPDGIYDMTFRIHAHPVDDVEVWFEENRPVEVINSTIAVVLGEEEPLDILPFDEPYWLAIAIDGGDEMMPRIMLTSAPYALQAGNADYLGWRSAEAYADTAHMHHADHIVEGVLSIDRIPIGHTADEVAAGNHYHGMDNMADVDTMGLAVGRVLAYDGSMWRPSEVAGGGSDDDWTVSGNDQYSAVSGNVGIGTTTPAAKLDVQGNLTVGAPESEPSINFWGNIGNSRLWWDGSTSSLRYGIPGSGSWAPENMGQGSLAGGFEAVASGPYATAFGYGSWATGLCALAAGYEARARGEESVALGWEARADTTNTFAAGTFVRATQPRSMVLGSGDDIANPLVNNVENSLVVGFDTTTPTLFVGGEHERVGIGTANPGQELEVEGTVKADGFVMSTGSGDGKVLTSDAGGYASWQDAPATVLADYYEEMNFTTIGATTTHIGATEVTIVAPTSGILVVRVLVDVVINHTQGTFDQFQLGVSNDTSSYMGLVTLHEIPAVQPTADYRTTLAAEMVSHQVSAGTHTYYANCQMNYGQDANDTVLQCNLVATFYPD